MEARIARIKEKLKDLPMSPGVYLMKNKDGAIIYVGKSKVLKNRVSQYFQHSAAHTEKTLSMVSFVEDFDYILTDTEAEALVLECNLIKKHRPKYNILLKDDKQYPYIKITLGEDYPRIMMTRRVVKDGSRYFGPYMSAFSVKNTLDTIRSTFGVRSCNKKLPNETGKGRPCLYYYMKKCMAPCVNNVTREEYREVFGSIADVLNGDYEEIVDELNRKMLDASKKLEFERAARYRDKINSIKILGEKQKIISTDDSNRDMIGVFKENGDACVQVFYIRSGKVLGSEYYVFENTDAIEAEILESFLKQFYFGSTKIPKEILISLEFDGMDVIQDFLRQRSGYKTELRVPKRGEKAEMMRMVLKNAEQSLMKHRFKRDREEAKQNYILSELMKLLSLKNPPHIIESYDISNISGAQSIGVCIVYKNAMPHKSSYRKFNIKTVEGANDYDSMKEVLCRRIDKIYEERALIEKGELAEDKAKFTDVPDLILLDGGKGHVSAVKELFETLGEEIPVFGLVKDDKHRTRGITDEKTEFPIDKDGELFKFLTCMQDEVHRFAINTYRKKHEKSNVKSELDNIDGVGKKTKLKLLTHFLSLDKIKSASKDELNAVVNKRTAENIYNYFGNSEKRGEKVDE